MVFIHVRGERRPKEVWGWREGRRNERRYGILKLDINGGKSKKAGSAPIQLGGSCIFLDYASNL